MKNNMKKKILFNGEISYAATGYGTYAREVLSRLYATNKYEIAEFASYCTIDDKRNDAIPWKLYVNDVNLNDPRRAERDANQQNQWGKWRFEKVLLDFQPDIVFSIRDYWMDAYMRWSPFRKYFHWAWMPTVDSAPQQEEWIDDYIDADAIFTYSDWAIKVLNKQSNNKINVINSAPPAVDINVYKPVADKKAHKKAMGFSENSLIVGTVMRNQIRKLFPDLFKAFRMYLDRCRAEGKIDLYKNSLLYVHSSYPDIQAWHFPELLKEHELGNKVVFSYVCQNPVCKKLFHGFYQDIRTVCPHCRQMSGMFPNVNSGANDADLANIYNCFDLYCQYSIAEGAGMPQEEAAVCGVPVMSTNYSAMEDIVAKTDGFPIKVERMFKDIGTQAYRAYPDNKEFVNIVMDYFTSPYTLRCIKGKRVAEKSRKYYNWERTSKIWEDYFDSVKLKGLQGKWTSPQIILNNRQPIPKNLTDGEFVNWVLSSVLGCPELANSYFGIGLTKDLQTQYGVACKSLGIEHPTRENIYNAIVGMAEHFNRYEHARTHLKDVVKEDFIKYANIREEAKR